MRAAAGAAPEMIASTKGLLDVTSVGTKDSLAYGAVMREL